MGLEEMLREMSISDGGKVEGGRGEGGKGEGGKVEEEMATE